MTFDSPIGIYGKLCRIDCCCCCASVQHIFRTKSGLLPNWAAVYQYVAGVLAMLLYAVCLVLRKHYAYYVSWVQAHYQVYDGTIGRVESYYTYSYGSLYDTYIFTYVRVDNSSTTNTDEESRRAGESTMQPVTIHVALDHCCGDDWNGRFSYSINNVAFSRELINVFQ